MQIIFLSERTLAVLGYGYASDDFEIILDSLVPQQSFFHVNLNSISASVGDYLTVRKKNYFYI
ncbi:MAG TPA: hypothetical protein PLY27_05560, partial [Bacilli bacterium]|nr:hypothetical protein [Bacilli bacterium]